MISKIGLVALSLSFNSIAFGWIFVEKSTELGLSYQHGYDSNVIIKEQQIIAGGLAIGDVNGDGWDDIFAVTGETLDLNGNNINPNKLFISQKNGTFVESSGLFGLNQSDVSNAGPLIADFNGDGLRDLILGSVSLKPKITLYINSQNNGFNLLNHAIYDSNVFSISASDSDKDGDLDLFLSHWIDDTEHIYWRNNGHGVFSDITSSHINYAPIENGFTSILADINNDNTEDLLLTNDFGTSTYFENHINGTMLHQDSSVIDDENGMGASIGDYDNDGDLDWFASSIYDSDGVSEGNWGVTGNRLYQNNGNGTFNEVSELAGVRKGFWGWGSCFADFNNDMYLDIFHVNGFPTGSLGEDEFINDPSRLFINNQDGTFTEMSAQVGLIDKGMGRAIICYDNDRDGDIDIFINNNQNYSKFYENHLDNNHNYLAIKLIATNQNMDAIGAKLSLTANGTTQLRQVISGGSFASSNPTTQHFGLANNDLVDSLIITWPDGTIETYENFTANRLITITKGQRVNLSSQEIPALNRLGMMVLFLVMVGFLIINKLPDK